MYSTCLCTFFLIHCIASQHLGYLWGIVMHRNIFGGVLVLLLLNFNSVYGQVDLQQLSITDYQACITNASQRVNRNSDDFEAHYYLAVCYARLGYTESSNDRRMNLFEMALNHANEALRLKPDDFRSHHAMGMTLGRTAEFSSARDRVAKTRDIKEHADRAIELNPAHGGSWIVLGQLIFRVANLSNAERLAANVLFGGFPFEASNDMAFEAMNNAIKHESEFIYHYLTLARAYLTARKNDEAREVLLRAQQLEPLTPDDPDHLESIERLLDRIR